MSGKKPGQRQVDELFVLEWRLSALDLLVRAQARQALRKVTPVRRDQRAVVVVRAGGRDIRAGGDQQASDLHDPPIARRRAGLDYHKRLRGRRP